MIQIHRLEGFFWVAKTGGYAKAARAFPYPITQPAVHQQVKKLESELGLQLFERVGKEVMKLTPAGRHLYGFAAPFFEQLPAVVRSLRASDLGGDWATAGRRRRCQNHRRPLRSPLTCSWATSAARRCEP